MPYSAPTCPENGPLSYNDFIIGNTPFFSLFKNVVRSPVPLSRDVCGTASWVLFSKLKPIGILGERVFSNFKET